MKRIVICTALAVACAAALAVPEDGWVSLFDGHSLDGWQQLNGTAAYVVGGGAIVGITNEGSGNSFLGSAKMYGDFELEFEVKCDDALNSGVQIRSLLADELNVPTNPGVMRGRFNGPQVEIEASPGQSGFIYGEAMGTGWLSPEPDNPDKAVNEHSHFKNGEWNHYRIIAKGPRIQTFINGAAVADLTDEQSYASHPKGYLGLQVHAIGGGQGPLQVMWRNIRIKEL